MRRISFAAAEATDAPSRVVLMPGAYQAPEDFVRAGFVDAVRTRALAIDLEFVAPELAHLLDRRILLDLRREVVEPARAAGCRSLWLGGASLGGFIALSFAERWPSAVDGLCLLAPYLGNRMVTGEIRRAGGLDRWEPGAVAADDEERRVWQLIRRLPELPVEVHLGLGQGDRFGHGHALFAEVLPPGSADCIEGGHDWPTWLGLWERFLDRLAARETGHHGGARV